MVNRILFVIYMLYCFEVGLFLLIFPWLNLWDQNSLLTHLPEIRPIVLSNYFRGAVSGLGIANLVLGVVEVTYSRRPLEKVGMEPPDSLRDL